MKKTKNNQSPILWKDRKRILGMPITFTKYYIQNNRLNISRGFISTEEDEILIYRILDVKLKRTILDRLLNVGNVILFTADETCKTLVLEKIKDPKGIMIYISNYAESERVRLNIAGREMYGVSGDN